MMTSKITTLNCSKEAVAAQNWRRILKNLDKLELIGPVSFDFTFFLQTIATTPDINYDIGRMQTISGLSSY